MTNFFGLLNDIYCAADPEESKPDCLAIVETCFVPTVRTGAPGALATKRDW